MVASHKLETGHPLSHVLTGQSCPHILQGLHLIPYKDLGLDANSTIIGHATHCLIYQAYYSGMAVTVKRLVPPGNPKTQTIFKQNSLRISPATSLDESPSKGFRQTQSRDHVQPAALTAAQLRSSSIGPISPIVVGRESSKALLSSTDDWGFDSQLQDNDSTQWRLWAQQVWVIAKAKAGSLLWLTLSLLSGQYFNIMLLKRRVCTLTCTVVMMSSCECMAHVFMLHLRSGIAIHLLLLHYQLLTVMFVPSGFVYINNHCLCHNQIDCMSDELADTA